MFVLAGLASSTLAGNVEATLPVADPAGTFFTRTPQFDSAVIKSDRLGGNFAYSVAEAHAYTAHTPIVQQIKTPVAVTYNTAPVSTQYYATAPDYYSYNPYYATPTYYTAKYY